ncbi:hypothetical protein COL60_25120 [Bacillus pseudomycoides]|nr:hypothetical protein COL60_25120 [Bacillus pseudomycoides]
MKNSSFFIIIGIVINNLSISQNFLDMASSLEKQGMMVGRNTGCIFEKLGIVFEGNTNNTNFNNTKLTIMFSVFIYIIKINVMDN